MTPTTAAEPKPLDLRAALSHPDALYEVVDGQIVELPEMGIVSAIVAMNLYNVLLDFARRNRIGRVVIEAILILDPDRNLRRRPDVAFVSHERWPADRTFPDDGDWEVVPDLAVEVTSPHDLDKDVLAKVREYFGHGVRRVWIMRPAEKNIYIYESPTRVTIFGADDELTDEALFPGLRLPVGPLFQHTAT